jgi:LuxR family maltose regulon positive regulatory protein
MLQHLLINDISKIDERFILVIDDYQLISEGSIHELVSVLVRSNIPAMHLVLLTRRDPPLPLHKFRGRGQITEITLKDLMFTHQETREFFRRASGLDIGEKDTADLDAHMEGWATGMRLISYMISDRKDLKRIIQGLTGSYSTVADYLIAEILARQPADISELLLATSILERFDESVCDYFCESAGLCVEEKRSGRSFISWLRKNNLFIISLDAEGRWFRYHRLFRQLLISKLEQTSGSDEVAKLQRQAGRWFADRGFISEAVRLAVQGEDIALGISIINDNRDSLIAGDMWNLLEAMINTLPRDIRSGDPDMLMAESWVLFVRMNVPALIDRVRKFERFLDDDAVDKKLKGEYYFFRGYIEYFMSNGHESFAHHEKSLELIPNSSGLIRGEAELHLVLSSHMAEGRDKAIDMAKNLIARKRRIDKKHLGRLWAGSSFVNLLDMDLGKAVRSAKKMITSSSSDATSYVAAWGRYLSALAHLVWNDANDAHELCESVLENRFDLGMRTAADSYCIAILALLCGGQLGRAKDAMLSLVEYADQIEDPTCSQVAASFRARFALMNGDLRSAGRWLRTADLEQDANLMLWWIEVPQITGCRVLIAEGRQDGLEHAVNMLKRIVQDNKHINNRFQQAMSMPLLAVALYRQSRTDEALKALREAIAMAKPARAIYPFMEFRAEMRELLEMIDGDDGTAEFAKLLLDAIAEYDSRLVAETLKTSKKVGILRGDFLMEALTNRELVALRLLSEGHYYKEIADEMSVSKDTVKTHLRHVYQKLRAGSRREAVSRAREIGILNLD